MYDTRRTFLKKSAGLAATGAAAGFVLQPRTLSASTLASVHDRGYEISPFNDPDLKPLIQRGLDAAHAFGASYADVRLTYTRSRIVRDSFRVDDEESITVGVRALLGGYWGFASGPLWNASEITRLGQEAARQAKTNTFGKPRLTELAPTPIVRDGHWIMPVAVDPFLVHPAEVSDLLNGVKIYAFREGAVRVQYDASFHRQDKAFGSTDGSYYTQRVYRTEGSFSAVYQDAQGRSGSADIDFLSPAGVGLELFDEARMRGAINQMFEDIRKDSELPVRPIDVGRYDTAMSASAVAALLSNTVGVATELDRALGYEANAGGTSYLSQPQEMLDDPYRIGAPSFSVTANRSDPGGVASVQWDDEGVVPAPFPIVANGVLADYHTTREGASWLKESYAKRNTPIRSHGCAFAPSGVDVPMPRTANLVMEPETAPHDMEALIRDMPKGIVFKNAFVSLDFQQLNGFLAGQCYEISNGKRVAQLMNAGAYFRAPELWKSLTAIGGRDSSERFGQTTQKGQPAQTGYHSVTAVPGVFEKLTIIDIARKA